MSTQNNPAFPLPSHTRKWDDAEKEYQQDEGMTMRQYAALKLKVPDSGEPWLDDMIRKSLLNDFAGQAMNGLLSDANAVHEETGNKLSIPDDAESVAIVSCEMATAMLNQMEQK